MDHAMALILLSTNVALCLRNTCVVVAVGVVGIATYPLCLI